MTTAAEKLQGAFGPELGLGLLPLNRVHHVDSQNCGVHDCACSELNLFRFDKLRTIELLETLTLSACHTHCKLQPQPVGQVRQALEARS